MMGDSTFASRTAMAIPGLNRGWMLALGLLMVVLGLIGLRVTYSVTVAVLFWSGILALIAGIGHLLDAFHHKAWRGVAWHIIVGLVYLLLGIMLTVMPVTSAFWLTKFVAVALVVTGVMRLVILYQLREQRVGQRFLLLVSGAVSIGLGIYVYLLVASPDPEVFATAEAHAAWVRSWKWVIGLFVALELITEGLALITVSVSAKATRES